MKIIIAGGRDLEVPLERITEIMGMSLLAPTEIVSGASGRPEHEIKIIQYANGIDGCGEKWAKSKMIPIKRFPAKFKTLGLSGGPARNRLMAEYADVLILIWDGKSRGSASMLREMTRVKKRVIQLILS
jgi:hypothetical protein